MEKYGKEIFEGMKEKILAKIYEENWGPFQFKNHYFCYNDFDKGLSLCFEKKEFGFQFDLFADEVGEGWLEHLMMGMDVFVNTADGLRYVSYKRVLETPGVLKKIYRIVKEEVEHIYKQNKQLKLKYVLNGENMLQVKGQLYQVLKEIEKREVEK